ncbi:PaaI family thioesterase [Algiphilus sp.]|uniref:PaaI family thioesterase n=1 Tax=Algiphilus sp. TaxID=1872431 RepID=UPI0032EAE4C0
MTDNPYQAIAKRFLEAIPHNQALGIELIGLERGRARCRLAGKQELQGDPERGLYFPSVLLTLADAASGVAFVSALGEMVSVATLDLRIDYLRPVAVADALVVDAHCYRYSGDVGFVQCDVMAEGGDVPAARVTSSFMRRAAHRGETA